MEVVTQFSSMFLWEYPSSVTRNDIFQQLIFDDIRKPGPVIDPENPEARWKAYSVTRFHCNTRNKLNKQARAIKSLVDLTVAGVLSQREVIRNIYFRAAACFPLACDEILIVAHQLWNEIWYDFMVIEYCQYCVFEGRINGMLSEKDSSAPARDIMSQSSLSKMSALLSYFSKSPIKKDQTFPAEIFTGLTSDSVFNAIQSTLCYSGIILNFQLGYYWVLFILLNLPTAEMGLRAVISELAVQSLRDEHCSRDFALVQLGVLLDSVHELDYLISPSMSIEAGDAAHHAPQFFCLQDMLDSYCREWFKSEHDRSAFLEWCAMFLC